MKKRLVFALTAIILIAAVACFAGDEGCVKAKGAGGACCAKGKAAGTAAACPMHAQAQMTGDVQTAGSSDVKAAETTSDKEKTEATCPHSAKEAGKAEATTSETAPAKAAVEVQKIDAALETPKIEASSAPTAEAAPLSTGKLPENCPDVKGRSELTGFHQNLHPMHMALNAGNYAEMRELFPKLDEASKGLAAYKCPMGDKCPPECKKNFETSKASLLRAVDDVRTAVSGTDDKRLAEAYMTMHEAYVKFGSLCQPSKETTTKAKTE